MDYNSPVDSPDLYVRALYDYTSNDHTSLSFCQGDVIQVLNQLETGWWDGVIADVRGWFPSNYCAVISGPDVSDSHIGEATTDSGVDDDYDDGDRVSDGSHRDRDSQPMFPIEGTRRSLEPEEAAFWIPQATADGRLFYYNTLTGYSTMELPLETPTSTNEPGPRDMYVPERTRAPDMMARGVDRFEDEYDGSASETEGESLMLCSSRQSQSFISDGLSPATSLDSINPPVMKPPNGTNGTHTGRAATARPTSPSSRLASLSISSTIPRYFLDDPSTMPITWSRLVDNMRHAIEGYKHAIMDGDRSQYITKAEDISDHLRMLLASGSDTTDNHSGNPSIISTNKALYPHFRDMMSKFSKLVLSSHIAAADWPGPDSAAKCLHEAEGVLRGVYGYVEVARQQRGEDIRRLVPGFVAGSSSGGHWQTNNISNKDPVSFLEHDGGRDAEKPSTVLDAHLVDRIEGIRKTLCANTRKLEEQLSLKDRLVGPSRHTVVGDAVCAACAQVLEVFRPWMSLIESIDLAPLGTNFENPQLADFNLQKQRVYDGIADLVLCCQAVSAPLADEWAESRGDPLETRLNNVRTVTRQLETYMSQIGFSLTLLQEQSPLPSPHTGGPPGGSFIQNRMRSDSQAAKPPRESLGPAYGVDDDMAPVKPQQRNIDKAQRFFGQALPRETASQSDDTPWFLKLDHEGEVFYDTKGLVPLLKCGTLAGLVEQLTRHDKLDTSFKDTFLLTYRSFTSASELFEMLVHRFTLQPPYGLDQAELKTWTEQKQIPIRIRVVNILKSWFENYWMEPTDDTNTRLLRRIHAFVKDAVATTKIPGTSPLIGLIEQRMRGQDSSAKRLVPTVNQNAPQSILPKNLKKIKFLDIDATEFARQLTIIESRLYARIKPTECLNKTWQKKIGPDDADPAVNVKALILHSNQLTNWVAEMILTQGDVKRRVVVIKHFVAVAEVCLYMFLFTSHADCAEMPSNEQLLNVDFHHLRSWNGANPPTKPDVGPGQRQDHGHARADA